MEWKIYTELNESRVKLDLNLPFFQNYWWLRSACNDCYISCIGYTTLYGNVNYNYNYFDNCLNCGIAPTCTI